MKKLIAFASAAAFLVSAVPALANGSGVTVENNNAAYVKNEVTTVASTGDNVSLGGSSVNKVKGHDNDNNTSNGGNGGSITTGNASAGTVVSNTVNTNRTKVKQPCECEGEVKVENNNRAKVKNYIGTFADTGLNLTAGGSTENKVKGAHNDDNEANGGDSGSVNTGNADAWTSVTNIVNKNVTRIRR